MKGIPLRFLRTNLVIPGRGHWRVLFLGFARGGWTNAARAYATGLGQKGRSGANWQSVDMRLLDLERVDTDLTRWEMSSNPSKP